MSTFDKVSGQYQHKALVQQAAAERLLALLNLGENEDVLDVGCGPGHITQHIKTLTQGRVVGTDVSAGMIAQARARYPAIDFRQLAVERLDYKEDFDVVFCNSALQWFNPPARAVDAMWAGLRPGGRIGVACPATDNWSICFKAVAAEAGAHADTSAAFARCKPAWVYLPDELEEHHYETEQAIAVFASGAAQGYTTKEFYDVPIDDDYVRRFNQCSRSAIEKRVPAASHLETGACGSVGQIPRAWHPAFQRLAAPAPRRQQWPVG